MALHPSDAADEDVTTTTYDRAGRMVATTGPDGLVTTYACDQRDRLIKLTENAERAEAIDAPCPTTTTCTNCNIVTRYRYDRVGMTDVNGALCNWRYNAADKRTHENIGDLEEQIMQIVIGGNKEHQ